MPDIATVQEADPSQPFAGLGDWLRASGPADWLCLGGLVVSIFSGYGLLFSTAWLLRHLTSNLLLTGSITACILGGANAHSGNYPLVWVVPLAVVGCIKLDVFYWWAGRRYGDQALRFVLERGGLSPARANKLEQWTSRWGPGALVAAYFLPFLPTTLVLVALGASKVSLWRTAIADMVGAALETALFVALGYAIGHPAVHTAKVVSHYGLITTIAIVVVVVGLNGRRGYRDLKKAQAADAERQTRQGAVPDGADVIDAAGGAQGS